MDSRFRNQIMSEFLFIPVFSVSHLLYPRHFPSLWSCGVVCVSDFFGSSIEVHCSLPVWYWWLVLSDFGSCSRCFLLRAESLTLACQVNITVDMNLSSIVQCPHCRTPHGTVRTFFQGSQQCLGKIGEQKKWEFCGNSGILIQCTLRSPSLGIILWI